MIPNRFGRGRPLFWTLTLSWYWKEETRPLEQRTSKPHLKTRSVPEEHLGDSPRLCQDL